MDYNINTELIKQNVCYVCNVMLMYTEYKYYGRHIYNTL